jgi:hypothetical protein
VSQPGPDRGELLQLYQLALDEYRFQVTLNWQRTQYYLAFNALVFGAASGISNLDAAHGVLAGSLFVFGAASAIMAILASRTQQRYYQQARDLVRRAAERLGLAKFAVQTTPGLGSTLDRFGKVTTYNYGLLSVLAAADIIGLITRIVG